MPAKKRPTTRRRVNRRRTPARRRVARTVRRFRRGRGVRAIRPYVMPTIAPARLMIKMPYEEVLNVSYAGTAECIYRTASLYDPQYSLVGMTVTSPTSNGQPGFFDVVKNWYRAYICRACNISLHLTNNSGEVINGQYIVTTTSDGPIANTYDWNSLRAMVQGNVLQGQYSSNAWRRKIWVDNYKVTGSSKADAALTQNNLFTSTPGSNPALSPYFQFSVQCADGSGTVSGILRVQITYYAEFFNPKVLTGNDT